MYKTIKSKRSQDVRNMAIVREYMRREELATESRVFVDILVLPDLPTLASMTTAFRHGTLAVLFWDDGPREGLVVLSDPRGVEVYAQPDGHNCWVISVAASKNITLSDFGRLVKPMFRDLKLLRDLGILSGRLQYRCRVSVLEDRLGSTFEWKVTDTGLVALMQSWLHVSDIVTS